MIRTFVFAVVLIASGDCIAQQLWGSLPVGPHAVGFKLMRERDPARDNRPMVVSLWYPGRASASARQVLLKDYPSARIINATFTEPTEDEKKQQYLQLHHVLEAPFIFGAKLSYDQFAPVLEAPTAAKWDLKEARGKFPLVVMRSEPEGLSVTAEYLASNGFVVAAIHAPYDQDQQPDSLFYVSATKDLLWLLNRTKSLGSVDQNKIAAIGFGGGVQGAFYITMLTDKIKGLVNLEGGVFGPRSKTDKNINYFPEKMRTPMLHIIATSQQKEDDIAQESALVNTTLYRAFVQHESLRHHDFSIYGRVYGRGLNGRTGFSETIDPTYTAAHTMMVEFLKLAVEGKASAFQVDQRFMPFISLEKFSN